MTLRTTKLLKRAKKLGAELHSKFACRPIPLFAPSTRALEFRHAWTWVFFLTHRLDISALVSSSVEKVPWRLLQRSAGLITRREVPTTAFQPSLLMPDACFAYSMSSRCFLQANLGSPTVGCCTNQSMAWLHDVIWSQAP